MYRDSFFTIYLLLKRWFQSLFSSYFTKDDRLIALLNQAKDQVIQNHLILTAYKDVNELVDFLNSCIRSLNESNRLTTYQFLELVGIFAPTGEWDDAGGSQSVANDIIDILETLNY